MKYFEDLTVGDKASFGSYEVTREEVLAFAGKYDPQPFHLSDEAAAKTHFGRMSASGWHTCAMTMAMFVEHMKANPSAS
ncbi:MAG TPA: MaoC/PaaZ C-terminal domain-containing protein, partial [Sphingobium sp.]|nr:MaoC/PaaZ C-terminal domain-containing protein [Sphingobium sp.]